MSNKKFFIGILTFFKNERSIIYEWIIHYKKWGIEHIWMIDNGSEDDYNIDEFINEGFVTVYKEPRIGQQASYDKYLPHIKKYVKWLGVFDMDEFLYSKVNYNLKNVISNIDQSIEIISILAKLFLPATFESTNSVIENNIIRKRNDSDNYPKCLFNLDLLNKVNIHGFKVNKKLQLTPYNKILCINHYRYTSFEYLYGIKEGRGGGCHKSKYKTTHYFTKVMILINSLDNKNFLPDDTYLRDCSKDVIEQSKKRFEKPLIQLYPQSSWLYLKNNLTDKYNLFKSYNNNNQILTHKQIYEINMFLNDIAKQLF